MKTGFQIPEETKPCMLPSITLTCRVENMSAAIGSPSVESVGEDSDGGFMEEIGLGAGEQGVAGGAFEAAEGFDSQRRP
jgi:hypothetical protein